MSELVDLHRLELLARAIFGHLWPMTGTRGFGTATVTAEDGGGDITLPRNSYLLPIVDGVARENRLYKVAANPDTDDGSWEIPEGGSLSVNIYSNIGGAEQNLPAGSSFRFFPRVPGLEVAVVLDAPIVNATNLCSAVFGADEGLPAPLKRMVFWQTMETSQSAIEFFQAEAGDFPALLMVWTRSVPLQGRTTGGEQGVTRVGRGRRTMREGFDVFVGSGTTLSATDRRMEAHAAMEAVTQLLTDAQINVDGELLSSTAGLEITARNLAVAAREHYIYQLTFDANQTYERVDRRTYNPWDLVKMTIKVPGREAPEPTEELDLVDEVVDDVP